MADGSSPSSPSDEDLMAQIQRQGSHAAFSELVTRHADKFRALAYRFTNSVGDAEDIVQDSFVTLWLKPQSWRAEKNTLFTTWFYRIVVNKCLDLKRRKKTAPLDENDVYADKAPLPDAMLEVKRREAMVESAFRCLSQDQQIALNLSFYEPVPNQEAADIMGMSLKAFQSLLMRAKTNLRERVTLAQQPERKKAYG